MILAIILLAIVSTATIFILERVMKQKKFKTNKIIVCIIFFVYLVALYFRFGITKPFLVGFFLINTLIYASFEDISFHIVDDCIWVIVLCLSVANIERIGVISIFASLVFFTFLYIVLFVILRLKTGGADIKLSISFAFLLGLERSIFALLVSTLIALITMTIYYKKKKISKDEAFPLVPFLAIGALMGFLV